MRNGSGIRVLECEPEQSSGVATVHGRPTLAAIADVARDAGALCCGDEHAGKSVCDASLMHRPGQAHGRGAHALRCEFENGKRVQAAAANGSVGGGRVLFCRWAPDGHRRAGCDDERFACAYERRAKRAHGQPFLCDVGRQIVEVIAEGKADHPVGLLGACGQHVEIAQAATNCGATCCGHDLRRALRACETEDLVSGGDEFRNDNRTDTARSSCDENAHDESP
jgi:hypothetical protein